jgi:hypothetical protein
MAYIGGDKVLMYGGTDPYQASYNDTWVFDLSDGTWAGPLGPTQFPSTRWSHAMVYVGEDKVLLFGGHHGGSSISSETWVYDLSDGEWTLYPVS